MGIITRCLVQDVTHWVSTADGYGGYTFAAPVTLKGRWEDRAETFRDTRGEEATSDTVVYLDTDVAFPDYLFLGISTTADPQTLSGAHQVRQFRKIPNLRASAYERKAFL